MITALTALIYNKVIMELRPYNLNDAIILWFSLGVTAVIDLCITVMFISLAYLAIQVWL